jgi:hypothetical protein
VIAALIVTDSLYVPGPTIMVSPDEARLTAFEIVWGVGAIVQLGFTLRLGTHHTVGAAKPFAPPASRTNTAAIAAEHTNRF